MAPAYKPQLARLVKAPPDGDGWLHEMKYDGYRIGADVRQQRVTLVSRNGKDWTAAFPEVADAVRALGVRDALFDGEVAILLPDGRTSFQALQNAGPGQPRRGLTYFVFDLLRLDGRNLRQPPLVERKRELQQVLTNHRSKTLRFSEHVVGRGPHVFEEACRLQLEGIISKQHDAPYTGGRMEFARALALEMERRDPSLYTTAFAKAGRKDKMLIDYLRNNRTNTSVAAFSPRARPGATVSAPLRWTDLKASLDPASLTMTTIEGWLRRRRVDPWKEYWRTRQRLPRRVPWAARR